MVKKEINILCVCIHNSARSQIAEVFLNNLSENIIAKSAGIQPGKLNQLAVASMLELGIDISKNKTKSIEEILRKNIRFDYVIFVCAESQTNSCPVVPYEAKKIYWPIDDPSLLSGTAMLKLKKIALIRDKIQVLVKDFIEEYEIL